MPAAIPLVAAAFEAYAGYTAVVAGAEIVGGMMLAGSAMSAAGALTGNKDLSNMGAVVGLAGGVAGMASGAFSGSELATENSDLASKGATTDNITASINADSPAVSSPIADNTVTGTNLPSAGDVPPGTTQASAAAGTQPASQTVAGQATNVNVSPLQQNGIQANIAGSTNPAASTSPLNPLQQTQQDVLSNISPGSTVDPNAPNPISGVSPSTPGAPSAPGGGLINSNTGGSVNLGTVTGSDMDAATMGPQGGPSAPGAPTDPSMLAKVESWAKLNPNLAMFAGMGGLGLVQGAMNSEAQKQLQEDAMNRAMAYQDWVRQRYSDSVRNLTIPGLQNSKGGGIVASAQGK
jgi:hypothetical protein